MGKRSCCCNRSMSTMRPERGFALVAALFVMVIVALVVATMSRLSVTQTASVDLALQQARAYQAARAGLEWGISRAMAGQSCNGSLSLDAFSVAIECANTAALDLPEEGRGGVLFYQLTATAESGLPGSADHAWRQLRATVER